MAALALLTFGYSSVLFLTEALRLEFRLAATALPDLTVQSLVAGRPALIAENEATALASIAGVVGGAGLRRVPRRALLLAVGRGHRIWEDLIMNSNVWPSKGPLTWRPSISRNW